MKIATLTGESGKMIMRVLKKGSGIVDQKNEEEEAKAEHEKEEKEQKGKDK